MDEARFLARALVFITSLLLTVSEFHSSSFLVDAENLFFTVKMTGV